MERNSCFKRIVHDKGSRAAIAWGWLNTALLHILQRLVEKQTQRKGILMAHPAQQKVLQILRQDWAEYIPQFHRMSPEAQAAFLAAQGYARFGDLLAHIVAWWQVGHQSIQRYLSDPTFQPPQYDVDAFNADAVAQAAAKSEDEIAASFEAMRAILVDFVEQLPETAFENEKVLRQLNMEFTGHLSEHQLPQSQ